MAWGESRIIEAIERTFMVPVQLATLVGNLSRLIKKGKTFERLGPNIYGLIEWGAAREAEELFGREELESERGLDTRSTRIS